MKIKNVFGGISVRWFPGLAVLGTLALVGCVVEPVGGVAYIGPPPVVMVEPEPVYVAPQPVFVGPEVVVPLVVVGGHGYRRH